MNIRIVFLILIVISSIITIFILIAHFFIPKFIPNNKPLININFDDKKNLSYYLDNKENIKCEYSKTGIQIIDSKGVNDTPAIILMSNKKNKPKIYWKIHKKQEFKYLQLQCSIYLKDILKNKKKFPAIWLYIEDKNGKKHWELPHLLKKIKNPFGWKRLQHYFYIPSNTQTIHFIISQNSISGNMIIDKIYLTPCKINRKFQYFRLLVFILLLIIFIIMIIIFSKIFFLFWKQLLLFLIIIIGILGPKYYFFLASHYFHIDAILIQKLGHFFLYLIFSLFIYLNKNKFNLNQKIKNLNWYLMFILFLIAANTEFIQYFTFSRHMSFFDWLIDISGIISGILIAEAYHLKKNLNTSNRKLS